ncbi:MAG: NAD(P)H-hydrate dehydratase [Epulopiscium sp.]|nr:NAD(P)H-hydrate dehydratase [Candidatus Epulonipiscium sp.]
MKGLLSNRREDSHKGDYGRVLIIGGSRGMTGAPYLASQSALRTGSGLVYTMVPQSLETIMCIKLIEAIVKPIEDKGKGHFISESLNTIVKEIENMDALAIGPGMGVDTERIELIGEVIKSSEVPMVIDADGINCISYNVAMLLKKKRSIIITPHPGEMGRLMKKNIHEIQENREYYARYAAEKYNIFVVLKGHKTIVASPQGQLYINNTGNPGMATAGSGDVLTGIITSLLGQGVNPFEAAKLGVYLHGMAGDLSRDKKGEYGIIATDIVKNIPYSIKILMKKENLC